MYGRVRLGIRLGVMLERWLVIILNLCIKLIVIFNIRDDGYLFHLNKEIIKLILVFHNISFNDYDFIFINDSYLSKDLLFKTEITGNLIIFLN